MKESKGKSMKESTVVIAFIFVIFFLTYIETSRSVNVFICSDLQGVTTYVGRVEPPQELNLGVCKVQLINNDRYLHLRRVMKRVK